VRDIRALTPPFEVLSRGQTAALVDLEASLSRHLPLALAVLMGTTVLLLFLMTGSVVLPIKALAMNLLTLSAAFGILVLVFQDGWLDGLLGFSSPGALEATQPIFLAAVAFGLSTDYGVFLLARIKEARDAGARDDEAVAVGLERTGRIVTAAALLFCVAVGAFATSQIVFLKELGVGTALAVLIDATIVRALLVPSLMKLLGRRNWWAPRPLARLHARLGLHEPAPA
jgi:RND superfamily putative drug exporter